MINTQQLNELADKLSELIPQSAQVLKSDLDNNLRAVLESGLRSMNLVSREEFDVQVQLLQRTQEKLQQLEQQLQALEKSQQT